jgi:hypothetical protein
MHSIANTSLDHNTEARAFHLNAWWLYAAIVVFYLVASFVVDKTILTKDVYYQGFAEQMTAERIDAILTMRSSYWWAQGIGPFILVSIKAGFTALCLCIGVIFIGQDLHIKQAFRIALFAESVFVLQMAVQVLCGVFVLDVRVPDDYANFAPLSLLQAFDPATLALWMKHPLRTVNLFEVAYMLVLAYFLTPLLKKRSYGQTVGLVAASYGLGLLLWVVALAFLLLQVS